MAKKNIRFRIERTRNKQFRLHIDGGNNEPGLVGEAVHNKKDLVKFITSIQEGASTAEVVDNAPDLPKVSKAKKAKAKA